MGVCSPFSRMPSALGAYFLRSIADKGRHTFILWRPKSSIGSNQALVDLFFFFFLVVHSLEAKWISRSTAWGLCELEKTSPKGPSPALLEGRLSRTLHQPLSFKGARRSWLIHVFPLQHGTWQPREGPSWHRGASTTGRDPARVGLRTGL